MSRLELALTFDQEHSLCPESKRDLSHICFLAGSGDPGFAKSLLRDLSSRNSGDEFPSCLDANSRFKVGEVRTVLPKSILPELRGRDLIMTQGFKGDPEGNLRELKNMAAMSNRSRNVIPSKCIK